MLLPAVLCLPFSQAPYDRDYMRRANGPEAVRALEKIQLSFLVLFANDSPESERVVDRMRPIARALRGVSPTVLVNCSDARSEAFCAKKAPKVPSLVMFNQDFRFSAPRVYDGELDWDAGSSSSGKREVQKEQIPGFLSEDDVRQWIFENQRAIMDFSPAVEAIFPLLDAPTGSALIYFTPGHLLPTWMGRLCLLVHGQFRQVHQPGFNETAWNELDGYDVQDLVKPEETNVALIRNDGSVSVCGNPCTTGDLDGAVRWLAEE